LFKHCKSKQEGYYRVIYQISNCHPYILENKEDVPAENQEADEDKNDDKLGVNKLAKVIFGSLGKKI
jgi:hypothetical protein